MNEILSSIKDKLDFSEIDLTPPNEVVEEILSSLPSITNNMVMGKIEHYSGHVESYTTTERVYSPLTGLKEMLSTKDEVRRVDIQNDLGKQGEDPQNFECFLYTPEYKDYRYRLFFMSYGLAKYPVQFTLEESIANSISSLNSRYIVKANNRTDVEDLINSIFSSQKVVSVIQELIRISQSQKNQQAIENGKKC